MEYSAPTRNALNKLNFFVKICVIRGNTLLMPSPFPGMDPYLEAPHLWSEVHQRLITYISDQLQPCIRPKYRATLEERVYLLEPERSIFPDVTILQYHPPRQAEPLSDTEVLDEPILLGLPVEEIRQPYVEIVHNVMGEVITVIEVLSPVNKTGKGFEKYQKNGLRF